MSADNYILVQKTADGKYSISHRFASSYYNDEVSEPPREYHCLTGTSKGWSVCGDDGPWFETQEEAIQSSPLRPDWLVDPPTPYKICDTPVEAIKAAHEWKQELPVVEYGVEVAKAVVDDL